MKKAFTLIELLIVIIIIGILASMAVPQYQKMVEKSKLSQAFIKMDALRKGENIYYMQYDKWLDINSPSMDSKYDVKISALLLEPSDFSGDTYFSYWWGTNKYRTPDNKLHAGGTSLAVRTESFDGTTLDSYWLFNDDCSVWKVILSTAFGFVEWGERVR